VVYGYGGITQDWTKEEEIYGIRASFYPLLYVPIYYFLKISHLDNFHIIFFNAPKIFNGFLVFLMDYSLYRYCLLRYEKYGELGRNIAKTALIMSVGFAQHGYVGMGRI
jgi:phosphatidylinositol glycan class B